MQSDSLMCELLYLQCSKNILKMTRAMAQKQAWRRVLNTEHIAVCLCSNQEIRPRCSMSFYIQQCVVVVCLFPCAYSFPLNYKIRRPLVLATTTATEKKKREVRVCCASRGLFLMCTETCSCLAHILAYRVSYVLYSASSILLYPTDVGVYNTYAQ